MSTFSKKVTSAVAGLAIVFSMLTPIAGVSAAYTSLEAANELSTLGFIVDNSANPADYRLGDTISREELSKVIAKLGGLAVSEGESVYADADFASWAEKYANALNQAGYAASNTYFNPKSNTSKIEALKWVMEAREIATGSGDDWMAARVDGAVSAGIASAFSDYNTDVTRGQVFIWSAEAVDATNEVATEEDPLCELLGICEEETSEEETSEEETSEEETPVVSGDATTMISLSPESPSNGLAAVNTPRVAMLSFDVTAGSEDVTLEQVTLYHVGLGDRTNVDDVTVYDSMNESVSKTKNFSDNDLDISFDRDVVVQAGMTETFTVTATITDSGDSNTTYQLELTALEASTAVSGAGIVGAALTPTVVSNAAVLEVEQDTASDDVTIGEEVKLAGFTVEEKNDNEDVLIKTITLHQTGSIDAEYLEDLVLEADGEVVASGMMVNSDDELVMNVDYVLAADQDVEFTLNGVISGDVSETIHFAFEGADDVYAVGLSTGFNIGFSAANKTPGNAAINIANAKTVEGAEIDAVFDKSDVDETKVDVDDVLVGTLELTANSNDYEVTKVTVTVTGTAADEAAEFNSDTSSSSYRGVLALEDIYLGGQSFDSVAGDGSTSAVYTFEDVVLTQGVTEVLPLEFDIAEDTGLNNEALIFAIKVTEIEDDENNITYTDGGTNDVKDVLSTNAFDTQSIDIETASFTLTQTSVNDRELVLANGSETVLYKGKVSAGDSDDVKIEDFDLSLLTASTLTAALSAGATSATVGASNLYHVGDVVTIDTEQVLVTAIPDATTLTITRAQGGTTDAAHSSGASVRNLSVDLDDILDSATLNVGGSTYDADIDSDSVDFTSVNHVVAAGSDNVELLVTAVLQDDDSIGTQETVTLVLNTANVSLEDSDGETVATTGISTGSKDTTTTLREQGTFAVKVINEVDTDDNLENTVLAGSDSVVLAELELEAEYEDMDVEVLEFTIPGDFSDTLNNVAIMNGSSVIADGAVVTASGGTTTVKFEDFTVADADDLIEAELVADLATFTGEGDATTAQLGAVVVSLNTASLDVEGADSNNTITTTTTGTVAGESVAVVPTLLVFSVVESLSGGQAKVKITADSGDNTVGTSNETPEVKLNSLTFTSLAAGTGGYVFYKDGEAATQGSISAGTGAQGVTFSTVDVTFDNSMTYVLVPAATVNATYSLVLSGLVANYDVQDSSGTAVTNGAGLTTTLESDVSLGSKTY